MKLLLMPLLALLVVGCVQTKKEFIYSGLDRNSYGNLQVMVDRNTQSIVSPPSCDPDHRNVGEGIHDLSRKITSAIFSPIDGLSKVDETVIKEDLQSHFLMAGDPMGTPLVSILDRSENNIVFWHLGDLVPVKEVASAAQEYCSRLNKTAIYEGSARRCSEPKLMPVVVNGKRTMTETYVVSGFQCVGKDTDKKPVSEKNQIELIREIQKELIRLKYLSHAHADGKFGQKTKDAIIKFQSKYQIATNGLPTESLLSALKSH